MKLDLKNGDMRRAWLLLGAIDQMGGATLVNLVELTSIPRPTANDVLKKLMDGQIPGLKLIKNGSAYQVEDWGEIINKKGVKNYFNACNVGKSDIQ